MNTDPKPPHYDTGGENALRIFGGFITAFGLVSIIFYTLFKFVLVSEDPNSVPPIVVALVLGFVGGENRRRL